MYKHILIATDYSVSSQAVCKKAEALKALNRAKMSIVHIMHDYPKYIDQQMTAIPLDIQHDDELITAHQQTLGDLADEIGIDNNNRWLGAGDPAQQIVAIAKQKEADLIILGAHGQSGLKTLLGSTAHSVLHQSCCDVIAVHIDKNSHHQTEKA